MEEWKERVLANKSISRGRDGVTAIIDAKSTYLAREISLADSPRLIVVASLDSKLVKKIRSIENPRIWGLQADRGAGHRLQEGLINAQENFHKGRLHPPKLEKADTIILPGNFTTWSPEEQFELLTLYKTDLLDYQGQIVVTQEGDASTGEIFTIECTFRCETSDGYEEPSITFVAKVRKGSDDEGNNYERQLREKVNKLVAPAGFVVAATHAFGDERDKGDYYQIYVEEVKKKARNMKPDKETLTTAEMDSAIDEVAVEFENAVKQDPKYTRWRANFDSTARIEYSESRKSLDIIARCVRKEVKNAMDKRVYGSKGW